MGVEIISIPLTMISMYMIRTLTSFSKISITLCAWDTSYITLTKTIHLDGKYKLNRINLTSK